MGGCSVVVEEAAAAILSGVDEHDADVTLWNANDDDEGATHACTTRDAAIPTTRRRATRYVMVESLRALVSCGGRCR